MKRLFAVVSLSLLCLFAVGCPAQVPSTKPQAAYLAWTAPLPASPLPAGAWTGCGTPSSCTFGVYSENVATATTACDAITSANYKQIGTTAAGVLAFEDPTPGFHCYVVATIQNGAVSTPSNSAFANVPALPLAPSTLTTAVQTASLVRPALPLPSDAAPVQQLALNSSPLHLCVTVR